METGQRVPRSPWLRFVLSSLRDAQGMAWWAEYQKDPAANAPLLERILRYNEDDVRATFALRDWIEEFSRET